MLRSDNATIESVIHPSFSRFFEAPYSDHIPFQDGPEISFNGEVSTFIAVPVKRNDRLLSSNIGNPAAPGTFMSLLRTMGKNPGPGGPVGGLKTTSMRYLDFKRALLPSMLAAVRNMHPEIRNERLPGSDVDRISEIGNPSRPQSRSVSQQRSRAELDLHTSPVALPELIATGLDDADETASNHLAGNEAEREEERVRGQLLRATGLLLPTETQWYLLNELRIHAGAPERSESGIERLSHYYAQLLHLEPKFPFETDEIQMNFLWYEGFFPDRKVVTNCIQYEKAAVLFNVAAVYTTLATSQSLWTPDGKKKAAGAGVLLHIRDRLCARFKPKLDKGSDLSEPTLTAAAEIMLAQAMECFYEKATDTRASSAVTAKIAAQTSDFYEVAARAAKQPTKIGNYRFPERWTNHIKAKTYLFSAIAHMHTAPASAAEAAVGERIARVSVARELAEKAAKCSKENGGPLHELVQGHTKIITTAHSFLVHANFERHHHPTYDDRLLPPLRRPLESLVNAIPLEQSITDPRSFTDIFYAIMSPTNHVGVKQILDDCGGKIETGRSELMSCVVDIDCKLATLGLSFATGTSTVADPADTGPTSAGLSSHELQSRANFFLDEMRSCTSDEDAFSGGDMINCFNKLVTIAEGNVKESFDILNHLPSSATSSHVSALRTIAISCNTRVMESSAHLADLKRKWESGIGDVAAYTEDEIRNILPFGLTGLLQPDQDDQPHIEAARKERDMVLRKLEGLRRMCEEHITDIERLNRPGKLSDESNATSTAISIDVHSAIQSRHEQLRVVEEALKMVRREKDNLLNKAEHLSSVITIASQGRMDATRSRQVIEKLLTAMSRYREWRTKLEDELQRGLKVREDSCRLLVRFLTLPRDPPEAPGSGDSNELEIRPPPEGVQRDPLFSQLLHENSMGLSAESAQSAKDRAGSPLPYNPEVSTAASLTRLVELRSALSASGIHPKAAEQRSDKPRLSGMPPLKIGQSSDVERLENEWKCLFESQKETLAQLLIEKAESDLNLSRIQEQLQIQQIQHQSQQSKNVPQQHANTLAEIPVDKPPYHPLNSTQRNKPHFGTVRRKPAFPSSGIIKPTPVAGQDVKGKKPENAAFKPGASVGTSGAEKLRQILRFVGVKRDSQNSMLGGGGASSQALNPESRKSSYATAYEGNRVFSTASRTMGNTERPYQEQAGPSVLPRTPAATNVNPVITINGATPPRNGTAQKPSAASSVVASQPSFVELPATGDDTTAHDQLLAELSLADYDINQSPEGDMVEMLPMAVPDANLPSRMDDIYTQIRALMLSQDALRTQKANDMREALATILKSCNMRLGGVEDSMGRWTQRKMDDARLRLTDALERLDREDKRKKDVEREMQREQRNARMTDKHREDMYRQEKGRRERVDISDEQQRAEFRESERKIRELVEKEELQAEKLRKASFSRPARDEGRGGPTGDRNHVRDSRKTTSKGKERAVGEDHGTCSRQARAVRHSTDEAHAQGGQGSSRIARWVEDQRRMSMSSLAESAVDSGKKVRGNDTNNADLHDGRGIGGRAEARRMDQASRSLARGAHIEGGYSDYERIASAAAAAAAAGVQAAFRYNEQGYESQESPARAAPRREVPGTVSFSMPGLGTETVQPVRHTIRRKPSGGVPVQFHNPAEADYTPPEGYIGYDDDAYEDPNDGAAAAAEPLRRGSVAPHMNFGGHKYDFQNDPGRFKEHNDSLAREFIVGEPVPDRVARFERERRHSRRD
ncbi:hypothetical protein PhCBS80983_g02237 [Powellomyces hirtus]|uniref:BRO domain-containing protein 1 n=1 Tax=Powellomyces hirtus TaxID=109895 RepID=A0A507E6X1_9FUNG|nr:hypothetical protein PhCBS80983_g02237 [Powellomyces hirtus]